MRVGNCRRALTSLSHHRGTQVVQPGDPQLSARLERRRIGIRTPVVTDPHCGTVQNARPAQPRLRAWADFGFGSGSSRHCFRQVSVFVFPATTMRQTARACVSRSRHCHVPKAALTHPARPPSLASGPFGVATATPTRCLASASMRCSRSTPRATRSRWSHRTAPVRARWASCCALRSSSIFRSGATGVAFALILAVAPLVFFTSPMFELSPISVRAATAWASARSGR